MIIVKIFGGLGNQLFQYALGRFLSFKNSTDLLLDTEYYSYKNLRIFTLDKFAISARIATPTEISGKKHVIETGEPFNPDIFNVGPNVYLNGYWQSEKYFKDIEHIIKAEFKLKEPQIEQFINMLAKIEANMSVSLHMRRGDYLQPKHLLVYTQVALSYYEQAVAMITEKVGNVKIFVFSDDIAWAKNNLSFPHAVEFISSGEFKDYQELILMSACKHNIIANSSFSWWGAWLNENSDKIVISPKKWFVDIHKDERDIIPSTWVKL